MRYKVGDKIKYVRKGYKLTLWNYLDDKYLGGVYEISGINDYGLLYLNLDDGLVGYVHESWVDPAVPYIRKRRIR